MSWTNTLLLIAPSGMTADANQLALATGTDPSDVQTFGHAWYSLDGVTASHSICCTRSKAVVVQVGETKTLPPASMLPEGTDADAAQRALDSLTIWREGDALPDMSGMVAVIDPSDAWGVLTSLGLASLEDMP
tara:strand:- start:10809 stop:11207 length:399 start_codon:yes stop_codon:yes gene_type:complete